MNKIVKISAISALAALSLVGCIEEDVPTKVVTADQAAASDAALEAMVGAIPVSMIAIDGARQDLHCDFGYPSLLVVYDALCGNVLSVGGDANSGYDWFSSYASGAGLAPNYTRPYAIWTNYFNFLKSANDVISTINAGGELSASSMPYMASAKAFRALYYLDMARLYEPLANDYSDISNVEGLTLPYISETTSEDEARNNPRLSREEMFAKIFEDLDAAEQLYLTEGVVIPTDKVNPSLAVVYGLKARAYLWLGATDASNYAKAAEYARRAIDESGCTIMGEADWTNPTAGFNTPNNSWMWYLPQSAESVSNLLNYVAWLSPEATYGYGALTQMGVMNSTYDRLSDSDFRKKLMIGADCNYSDYKDVTLIPESNWEANKSIYPYANIKMRPGGGKINDDKTGNVTSVVTMRVEEMYLIEAEAVAHTDAAAGAALLKTFMANRDDAYIFAGSTSDEVVEEIIFQKGIEFWGEGVVFFDIKRLGLGMHTGYEGTNVATASRFDIDLRAPWWNMPIPESEETQNPALQGLNNPNPTEKVDPWLE